MLTIGKLGGSDGASRSPTYYTSVVASGQEDYYAGRGEAPGEWVGHGSAELGLSGEVEADDLAALMAGRRPASGEQLRRPFGERAVVGFDLTFSAPKSVSVLYGVGGGRVSEAVRRAHDSAVRGALSYLEREACRARRGSGGAQRVVGDGFVAGAFRHRTSRAGDPQLHTHAVVCNLTRGPDGRYSALDGRALYRQAKTAGYLYQAELRARLSDELGVAWGAVEKGVGEVDGVPRELCERFSVRRAEIVERVAEQGAGSRRARQVAAYETRRAKDYGVPLERLREEWRARAAEHGLGARELAALLDRWHGRAEPSAGPIRQVATELAGPDGLTRDAAVFDRRDVLRAWAERHRGGAPVDRIELLADRFISSPACVRVGGDAASGQLSLLGATEAERYSTENMLSCERRLLESAVRRRGDGAGVVSARTREAAIAARPTLAGEQAELVRSLVRSGDGVAAVRAAAGTGKTYALDAAREAWQQEGLRVIGATLSARAACELRDCAGIESVTTARLLGDLDRGFPLTGRDVLVIDEAGMVGTRALERIAAASAEGGAKLVLVGDDRQLPEIEAGGAFAALAERLDARELKEVRRQRDEWDRQALQQLRAGRPERWLRENRDRGRIHLSKGRDQQLGALVSDWWQARQELAGDEQAVMLAYRRQDVRELNERARAYMCASGRLDQTELRVGERGFCAGDRVLCLKNDRRLGVLNSQRGTIAAIEQESRWVTLRLDSGKEASLPASYIERGWLDHGYALTVHKSQGMSVERSFVLGSEDLYRELGYTALSQHRESCRFYINGGEPPEQQRLPGLDAGRDPLEQIVRTLGESRAKELALDSHERDQDLQAIPTHQLAADSEALGELLSSYPSLARRATKLAEQEEQAAVSARDASERLTASLSERQTLGQFARKARAELDQRIERLTAAHAQRLVEYAQALEEALLAEDAGERWLEENGATLAELCTSARELTHRRERDLERALQAARIEPSEGLQERLGERPQDLSAREAWDHAAEALLRYEQRFGEASGPDQPTDLERARAWRSLQDALRPLELQTNPSDNFDRLATPDFGDDLGLDR